MPRFLPVVWFLLVASFAAVVSGNVTVKREPPDIQRKTFDPANPPADMPHLNPGEDAVTYTAFRISAGGDYEPVTRKKGDNGWTTVIAVHGLTMRLRLEIVVWTPQGVSDKLKAHEEGHRKISERVYLERATIEAKAAGASADGKRFTGEGPDWKTAAENAVNPAISDVGKTYLHRTADVEDAVNKIYDEITHHGTNDKPEDDAIKEAFERYARENPTTQPAKGK